MSNQSMGAAKPGAPELIASGLGWPEGPTVMPDHSLVFVDTYLSQLTIIGPDCSPRCFAYTAGGPNSCVLGSDDALYVCQNGGTTGRWRAKEMVAPSIQRVRAGGPAETLITHVEGIKLNGPNDLAFAPDGSLVFSDPGTYNPKNPDPSYIHKISPDGTAKVVIAFPAPVFRNGVTVEADGSIVWVESYTGRVGRIRPNGKNRRSRASPGRQSDPRWIEGRRRRKALRHRHSGQRDPCPAARRQSRTIHSLRGCPDQLRIRRRDALAYRCRHAGRERRALE